MKYKLFIFIIIFSLCIFKWFNLKTGENTLELDNKISTVMQTTEKKIEETTEIKYTKGTFDSITYFSNFDYENSEFISDYTYKKLKKAYDEFDFKVEFKSGDTKLYDLYKRKFTELILNKCTFYNPFENCEKYLSNNNIDPTQIFCRLYFFDFDDDNEPELCVNYRTAYVFKYIKDKNKIVLMTNSNGSWNSFYGTKKIYDNWEGLRYTYTIYNENYETINEVKYYYTPIREGLICYMVAFPGTNKNQKKELDLDIQKEGYDLENTNIIYFRVTEEQYNELTKNAIKSIAEANQAIKKYNISYNELVNYYKNN